MSKKIFIMGAPNAGKSTYLAALWYSINQKELKTRMSLEKMGNNSQYLYSLSKKWLEIEQLERTVIGQEMPELSIHLTDGQNSLELEFPDLSGETFQNIYEKREMPLELYEKIVDSDAILYFINVENIYAPEFIAEMPSILRDKTDGGIQYKERKPCDDDPTQIQIIELLQAISDIKKKRIDLGIVFSAWDLVENMDSVSPRNYLEKNMNMLWQYIESNKERYYTSIWGVSALGGKIDDFEELLKVEIAVNRIKVVNESINVSHDVTSIIAEMVVD